MSVRRVAIWVLLGVLFVGGDAPGGRPPGPGAAPARPEQGRAHGQARIVIDLARQCVDRREPVDVRAFGERITECTECAEAISGETRSELVQALCKLVLLRTRDLGVVIPPEGPGVWGRDPRERVKRDALNLLKALGDKAAVPHLQNYYRLYGGAKTDPDYVAPWVARAIEALGGEVPVPMIDEQRAKAEEARRKANREETEKLIQRIQNEKLSNSQLQQILDRLGMIGDRRAVGPIIGLLKTRKSLGLMQSGMYAVGVLGGPDAQSFLAEQLDRPMPPEAKLDDTSEDEAMLRTAAVAGLQKCGDESVLPLLQRIVADRKQYNHVRRRALFAVEAIEYRASKQRARTQPATGKSVATKASQP